MKYVVVRNGKEEKEISFETEQEARNYAEKETSEFPYHQEVPGATWGAITSYVGHGEPDELLQTESETLSIWKK